MRKILALLVVLSCCHSSSALEPSDWKDQLRLYASFDHGADADWARSDKRIYLADSLERKVVRSGLETDAVEWTASGGRRGGMLEFKQATKQLVFFKGAKNVPYRQRDFQGTVSFWMRLNPRQDLPKGFVDPLQITDKKWNDASFFVDFDQTASRDFRLGGFANFRSWNPDERKFDDIPVAERPMVVVKDPPFSRDRWTHVVFTWSQLNASSPGEITLYLDGAARGTIRGPYTFTWDPEAVVIMLGINYVGGIDELVILDRAVTGEQVKMLQ